MGDIIDLTAAIAKHIVGDHCSDYDEFSLTEGLELLAAYRSINDVEVRQSIREFVVTIASATKGEGSSAI